ncbi:MAG: indolepyruvate oxidoreductase subunit beta [Eubacteriaceae bacterium]|nr:indolepyruvate oxidoreductase subunit beta [Eubacteriaceae bacterium]
MTNNSNSIDVKSCLLCGVGGQGTVLASRIIAGTAMDKGLHARTAETIGMAQRGGSVVSHVRIGTDVASPMIPKGTADIILGSEPGEAAANLEYLKEGGTVIVCRNEIRPVTASLGKSGYKGEEAVKYLKEHVKKCYIIDAEAICSECGSPKVLNVALTGALAACGAMDLTLNDIEKVLAKRLKPQLVEMNKKALQMGADRI